MTSTSARRRRAPAAAVTAVLTAFVASLLTWLAPAANAACPPAPWDCPTFGAFAHRGATTTGERVVVVGDSLVQNLGPLVADRLSANGFRSFTIGAGGYAYAHWNHGAAEGLDIGDYATRERADHVVIALGTNDGRLLAARPGVTQPLVADQVLWGMTRAEAGSSGCVILVSPSTRSNPAATQQVRDILVWQSTVRNNQLGTTRFVVADWGAHSAGHENWFDGAGNPHLTATGNAAYADFITFHTALARNGTHGC